MKNEINKELYLGYLRQLGKFFTLLLWFALPFFLIELFLFILLQPVDFSALIFGGTWALLLSAILLLLPKKACRIAFGIVYYGLLLWGMTQAGYYQVFDKLMWLSTVAYAGEGAAFLWDVVRSFPLLWWLGSAVMIAIGVVYIRFFPTKVYPHILFRLSYLAAILIFILLLCNLPEQVFVKDAKIADASPETTYRETYHNMYDAKRIYNMCGLYHLTMRDIWKHQIYPTTPKFEVEQKEDLSDVDAYFQNRGPHQANDMTGIFAGKNVILVLMESTDDWMITPEDTPTLYKMMNEGINFTNFYTPGYGSARTLNSEFCMNTGIYLPTSGSYVFDYIENSFDQTAAAQLTNNGYTAEVFHYNDPDFYSRGEMEPALGYRAYNSYDQYVKKNELYSETLMFDIPQMNALFFREGPTFNTVITRSAHLSYNYNENLSEYALDIYPEYEGLYGSEEEDCARVKAKLVDDLFARILLELEKNGQLENTVIIGMTDHYTYGYKNMEELMIHSGVTSALQLEKTPCFVWSANGPQMVVDKTLNTADLLPTMLNLMGIESPYHYLGQDAFDPNYQGYAIFPDGSWITNGIVCKMEGIEPLILHNENGIEITDAFLDEMALLSGEFIKVNNLLLTSDYYKNE